MFTDDITGWLPEQLVQSNNVVMAGDFNIHINKQVENDEAGIFMSTLELMGLVIYQSEETHKSGNILDLILIELGRAIEVERSKYRSILKTAKKDAITDMVNDCGRNSKKLYTLITNLTGTFKENPLLEGLSNKELAEQFAEFFITKIKKIRQQLDKGIYSLGSNGYPTHSLQTTDSQKRKWQA